jgi:cell division protein FtsL
MSNMSYNGAAFGYTTGAAVKNKNNVKGQSQSSAGIAQPVIRLRSVLIGICTLAVCMVGPLVLVWTQSYINQVSLRLEGKTEALAAVNSEITALGLECGHLSAPARIERIARSRGLEYPVSGQIEVWEVKIPQSGECGLFAYLKQTFFGGEKSGGPL